VKLIVGLGNPDPEYFETRHNLGFKVVEELASRYEVRFRKSSKWEALTARISKPDYSVVIAKPTTYMNLSGWAVQKLMSFHDVTFTDLLVIVDDADLPLGRLRIRAKGSAGGHNGLKSVIEQLGINTFPRLRIGVGRDARGTQLRDHVLGRFQPDEETRIENAVKRAADAAELFAREDIGKVMNTFNRSETEESGPETEA
jgi:peptidyl-tRNA hydrolase, PTH1 family